MSLAQLLKKQKTPASKKEKNSDFKKTLQKIVNGIEKNKTSVEIFKRESRIENVYIQSVIYSVFSKDDILKQSVLFLLKAYTPTQIITCSTLTVSQCLNAMIVNSV